MVTLLLVLMVVVFGAGQGGDVLMMPAYFVPSHRLVMYRLAEELVRRGHRVTVWELGLKSEQRLEVPFPQAANLSRLYWQVAVPDRHVQLAHLHDNASVYSVVWSGAVVEPARRAATWHMASRLCEVALETRRADFHALLARRFDAVLLDDLYAPCGLLHVGLQRSTFVYWSQTQLRTETAWANQSPSPPSYVPVPGTGLSDELDLWQRARNLLHYLKTVYVHQRVVLKALDLMFQKHMGPHLTPAFYVERNASLNFVNTPPLFDFPRAYMPRTVFVGGLHCRPAQPLRGKLAEFVAEEPENKHGFVVVSTGFSVQWKRAPPHVLRAFVDGLGSLAPVKFVWQFDGSVPADLPANIFVAPWLPQQDLLGHKNCRALVTTGGLNSLVEAMWHRKPVLGLPLFADHEDFLVRVTARGAGLRLAKADLSASTLSSSLSQLLSDPSYKENATLFGDLLRDVPYSELDHAAFWVEFIMRHGEIPFARSGADDLNLLQYFLVDVVVFLVACLLAGLFAFYWSLVLASRGVRLLFRLARRLFAPRHPTNDPKKTN